LAEEIGVSRQTIYAMETGTYMPNTMLALKLAQVLEVKVEDLFRLEEAKMAAHTEAVALLPAEENAQPGFYSS
jgi:DNA-binding XRE family transcriptional regulator